ncbi:MAG: hypothetical protein M3Q67_04675 [Actinomycetota bacterium]|nr:hypothetical protein [Actinomycetota bacterium]
MTPRPLAALDQVLEWEAEPDDVLRAAVSALVEESEIVWAGISFLEQGDLVLGPAAGEPDEKRRQCVQITYQGEPVGELSVDGETDRELLERVAALLSTHALVGWDTGGERWEP